jgi:hypothetical protein
VSSRRGRRVKISRDAGSSSATAAIAVIALALVGIIVSALGVIPGLSTDSFHQHALSRALRCRQSRDRAALTRGGRLKP